MGCNTCKGKLKPTFEETLKDYKEEKKSSGFKLIEYTSKFIVFLLVSTILVPIIIPILIFVLFKTLVLSHNLDIMPLLLHVGKRIFKEEDDGYDEDEEEEDTDEFDQDEYEELNKQDIVVLNNYN